MAKDRMPEWFKDYLKALPPDRKEQLWEFFDEDPSAIERLISHVGKKGDFPVDRSKHF
jgi:hypothetical protein